MSNELSTPKVAYCPSDSYHSRAATNFNFGDVLGMANGTIVVGNIVPKQTVAAKVSYFVCGDSVESDPQACLAGDLNIGNGNLGASTANNGPASVGMTVGNVAQAQTPTTPAVLFLSSVAWGQANGAWAWTQNEFHQKTGNLGLNDGSVQGATINGLHTYLQNGTNAASQASFCFPM